MEERNGQITTGYNSKFNLCPGEVLYAPLLQINYVSTWAEISAIMRAQLKLAKRCMPFNQTI